MVRVCGAGVKVNGRGRDTPPTNPIPLYIITTAKKRDTLEWERELARFGVVEDGGGGWLGRPVVIDSWNNIARYSKVTESMFIFDEQRLVGSGAWVRSFYRIARHNHWILLSGTPGDDWKDYIPVFVANGFYKSKAEFLRTHAVYSVYANYPKIDRWVGEDLLGRFRSKILVEVDYVPHTKRHLITKVASYDKALYESIRKTRWNPWTDKPIKDAGELWRSLRRVVNSDDSRLSILSEIRSSSPKLIVFYNFNYELEILRKWCGSLNVTFAEWNGQKHMAIPETKDGYVYLVQYTAGAEGWNCVSTDTVVFFSLTYSYKVFEQSQGRIDRRDTPFTDLYYYVLRSDADVDRAVWASLMRKKSFNQKAYFKKHGEDYNGFEDSRTEGV